MTAAQDTDPKLAAYAHPERLVTTAWLAEHLADPGIVVVESDEDVLLYDTGHIPGAHNRPFTQNLDTDGTFKLPAFLRAEFMALLDGASHESVVHQCGSGVSACHNILAMEVAGLPGTRLYPGSWSEWSADPARPIERGP